jgi:hypothetical protein
MHALPRNLALMALMRCTLCNCTVCNCCSARAAQAIDDWAAVRKASDMMTDELRDAGPFDPITTDLSTDTSRMLARRSACCTSVLKHVVYEYAVL